jgi:endoribonuclease Dicer
MLTLYQPVEDKLSIKEPAYIMSIDSRGYYCEVIMPDHSPIRSAFGQRYPRKGLAKRSAAFEMCFLLLKSEFLDNRLLSKFEKMRPIGANDHLAVSEKKTGKYVMQLKPSLWADGRGSIPDTVHLTIIDMPDGLERPHQPIGLLTRHPLPQFPSFPLFLDSEKITNVQTIPRPGFKVTENEIGVFTAHTLRLWYHVNAKVFEKNAANMSYWVVPVLSQWDMEIDSRNCIDWNAMETAVVGEYQRWTPDMPPEFLENKFIVDPWAGNRRFFSIGVDQSLKPLDNIPENTAKFDRPGANKRKSILQYSVSLFGQTFDEQWPKWNKEQPVIECTQVMHRQNLLAPPTSKEQNHRIRATRAFLCPEPLVISAVSILCTDCDAS